MDERAPVVFQCSLDDPFCSDWLEAAFRTARNCGVRFLWGHVSGSVMFLCFSGSLSQDDIVSVLAEMIP